MIDKQRQRMFVKPAPGIKVRMHHELHSLLPAGGAWVPLSVAWQRSLADGDVVLPEQDAPQQPKRRKRATKE